MAQRVLDQVRDHLRQELAIAGEGNAVLDLDVQRMVGILGGRLIGLADAAGQRRVELGEGALLRAGLDLGDAQQGREGFQELVGFGDGRLGRGVVVRRRLGPLARVFQVLAQPAERRAQVVGRSTPGAAVHELLDAAQHGVEAGDELVDLVCVPRTGMRAERSPSMMARLVRVIASMRRRKELASTAPPAMASSSVSPPAQAKARTMACCMSVSARRPGRPAGTSRRQGEAEAGELGALAVGVRRRRVGLRHEVDDAVDRRHAGQVADHDPAVGRLQQVEDRPARAEVDAPRDLLGEAAQAGAAMDLGELEGLERSTAAMSFCIAAVAVTYTVANRAPAEAMNSAA